MEIHHLRSATFVFEAAGHRVLVDPMLSAKGEMGGPLAFVRHRPRRNPTVDLPPDAPAVLGSLDAALVTHWRRGHTDHLDDPAVDLIRERGLPVWCQARDAEALAARGVDARPLELGEPQDFLGGSVTAFPAVHGYGLLARAMGPVAGFLVELPGEPSLYVSGDTVLTDDVRRVLTDRRPDVAVMAAGSASLDVGRPILMPLEELVEFARLAPGRVVANHLEALNHCPTTRAGLAEALERAGLRSQVWIPADGESLSI